MRAAAGLDISDLLRMIDVRHVEDADAAESLGADRVGYPSAGAVESAAGLLDRHEHQVFVDREIALAAGADHRRAKPGRAWVRDIPDLESVEAALIQVVPHEGQIGIEKCEIGRVLRVPEILRAIDVAYQHEVARGLAGIRQARMEPNAWVVAGDGAVALRECRSCQRDGC